MADCVAYLYKYLSVCLRLCVTGHRDLLPPSCDLVGTSTGWLLHLIPPMRQSAATEGSWINHGVRISFCLRWCCPFISLCFLAYLYSFRQSLHFEEDLPFWFGFLLRDAHLPFSSPPIFVSFGSSCGEEGNLFIHWFTCLCVGLMRQRRIALCFSADYTSGKPRQIENTDRFVGRIFNEVTNSYKGVLRRLWKMNVLLATFCSVY